MTLAYPGYQFASSHDSGLEGHNYGQQIVQSKISLDEGHGHGGYSHHEDEHVDYYVSI